ETDRLHAHIASQPVPESLRMLAVLGFGGVYVDRWACADNGAQLEGELRKLLGGQPIVSRNQRMAFYDMGGFARNIRAASRDAEWAGQQDQIRHGTHLEWGPGFFGEESTGDERFRWCAAHGEMYINNAADTPQTVSLRLTYWAHDAAPAKLTLGGPLVSQAVD